jgi:GNAT superfamily N-acetyltransferase
VRQASAADALCLSVLATQVFLETYATEGVRPLLAREVKAHLSEAAFEERLAQPGVKILVAERNAHLVAFAQLALNTPGPGVPEAAACELRRLYVQSPFLRQGIGSRLLREAEVTARAEAASTLWLTAWVGNTRALAFYAAQGYSELGRTAYVFEGESFENRVFAKTLSAH